MDGKKDGSELKTIGQIATQIWKIILLIFFFTCIILQAPLKLLIPLAVFLLAVIILPHRYVNGSGQGWDFYPRTGFMDISPEKGATGSRLLLTMN